MAEIKNIMKLIIKIKKKKKLFSVFYDSLLWLLLLIYQPDKRASIVHT